MLTKVNNRVVKMAADEALSGFSNIYGDIIGNNLQTAQYLLKIGDRLTSTVEGFNDFALVKKWNFGMEHFVQGYIADQVHPRRPTTATPLEVHLLHGDYIPKLFTMVAKQEIISDNGTALVVIGSVGDVNQEIMRINLTSAVVESVSLSTDYFPFFRVLIRFKVFEIICNNYDQETFTNQGKNAFNYDFSKNVLGG